MKFLLILAISFFIASSAFACSCMPPSDKLNQEAFINTAVIVKAKITQKMPAWNTMSPGVKLNIIEVIKGKNIPEKLTVNYNPELGACGHDYKIGEEYLIGLYNTMSSKNLRIKGHGYRAVNSCNKTYIEHYLKNKQKIEQE